MSSVYTSTTVSGYNSNPPPDDGTTGANNKITWAGIKSKLSDPLNTYAAAENTAITTAFGKTLDGAGTATSAVDYPAGASDQGRLVIVTVSGKVVTTPDATVVLSPFVFGVLNQSTGNINITGNNPGVAQTVDGSTTQVLGPGQGCLVQTDGANWFTTGLKSQPPQGTTGNRPGSPAEAYTRYNTTLHGLEYWNGTVWIALGQQPTVQTFTSGTAQTYTAAAGVVRQRVRLIGGGGGGGAIITNAGTTGGTTSFQVNGTGTAWTCIGGTGGAIGSASGGVGGAGGTGGTDGSTGTKIVRFSGSKGGTGQGGSGSGNGSGSFGGSGPFGGAGAGGATNVSGPTAAIANTGSGGGGVATNSGSSSGGGGSGEYVEFWVTGMTTATYTVGALGAGGVAGTLAGGAGAAGTIIVEEFYS